MGDGRQNLRGGELGTGRGFEYLWEREVLCPLTHHVPRYGIFVLFLKVYLERIRLRASEGDVVI